MPKKTCSSCGRQAGVRQKICPSCSKPFDFTPSCLKEKRQAVNWKELEKSDFIRVIAGSGPYWPKINKDGELEKINLGYSGIFKVHSLEDNGIHAYSYSKSEGGGHCFLYLGPTKTSPYGWINEAHKIVKVKRKIR